MKKKEKWKNLAEVLGLRFVPGVEAFKEEPRFLALGGREMPAFSDYRDRAAFF